MQEEKVTEIKGLRGKFNKFFQKLTNFEIRTNNNEYIIGYYDNKFSIYRIENDSFILEQNKNYLINSMVNFKTNREWPTANRMPLTYIEVIQYAKINSLNKENIVDYLERGDNTSIPYNQVKIKLQNIGNPSEKDFAIVPIRINSEHFANAIIKFKENTKEQQDVYIFDSLGNDSSIKIKQLNQENLQGGSETCGYWATNFAILASAYSSFQDLNNAILKKQFIEDLRKTTSLLIDQHKCYCEVEQGKLLKNYEIPENTLSNGKFLIGIKNIQINEIDDNVAQGQSSKLFQSLKGCKTINNNSINRKQEAEKSFVERIEKAREQRKKETKSSICYYGDKFYK